MNIDEMVQRFLGWKLPKDFEPDGRITFNKHYYDFNGNVVTCTLDSPFWPIGTNLFTADQARQMLEYVLDGSDFPRISSEAEFLSKRLGRVAKLVGVTMPDMSHNHIAAVAGTILGEIARAIEERAALKSNEQEPVAEYQEDAYLMQYGVKWLIDYKPPHGTKLFTHADAAEVQKLRAELAEARRTGEYWKAEHAAANAELAEAKLKLAKAMDVLGASI